MVSNRLPAYRRRRILLGRRRPQASRLVLIAACPERRVRNTWVVRDSREQLLGLQEVGRSRARDIQHPVTASAAGQAIDEQRYGTTA